LRLGIYLLKWGVSPLLYLLLSFVWQGFVSWSVSQPIGEDFQHTSTVWCQWLSPLRAEHLSYWLDIAFARRKIPGHINLGYHLLFVEETWRWWCFTFHTFQG
jgi:hypothetical protein